MHHGIYSNLKIFCAVAKHLTFTAAALELNMTKGAVSYQIKKLEEGLGFNVFIRKNRRVFLTDKGVKLLHATQLAFNDLDQVIDNLHKQDVDRIIVGTSTYFASRWLSPRLMKFTSTHPEISLRLQPMTGDMDLQKAQLDIAIRWGKGDWTDCNIESLLPCSAIPTAGQTVVKEIKHHGLEYALTHLSLLHDFEGSNTWRDWHAIAGLNYQPKRGGLVIPDPNVRVQAVIDGQGLALNDHLVNDEIKNGELVQVSPIGLDNYGYYIAYAKDVAKTPAVKLFRDWLIHEANTGT